MIQNHFIIGWRNLWRNLSQSSINIGGLALGLTAFIFIVQYISTEQSVNKFHAQLPQIYRLLNEDNKGLTWPQIEPGYAIKAKERIGEIKDFCRFENGIAQGIVQNVEKNISFREQAIGYVENNFFEFFSFPLIAGDPKSLKRPDVMFVAQSAAIKYFGQLDVLGKSLVLANQFGKKVYVIGGVFKDMDETSDIRYDMIFSLEALNNAEIANSNGWVALNNLESQYIETYFLLEKGTDYKKVEKELIGIRNELDKDADGIQFRLQPFSEVHMAKTTGDTYLHYVELKYIMILGAIALMILLIAWFNYINFSTAQALKRAGEVGVRKVIGATRSNLVAQFLCESILVNVFALVGSIALVTILQPLFNDLIGKQISWQSMFLHSSWTLGLALIILGAITSGAYTAYVLSNFNPVFTLKGKLLKGDMGAFLRKILVVAQFCISIALIIGTLAMFFQLNHMQNKDLGFAPDQLMVIQGPEVGKDSTYKMRREGFWNEIDQTSYVTAYCNSGSIPSKYYNFATSGFTQPKSKPGDELISYSFAIIGEKYLPTYKINLIAGRNFTKQECSVDWNDNDKVLINETAMHKLGFDTPEDILNTRIKWDERYLDVIGIIKDYHHTSVQQAIDPIIYYPQNNSAYYTFRLTPDRLQDKIAGLEKMYKKFFPGNPVDYFFIDENFQNAYQREAQFATLFTVASAWAIFIACLGLFGLASFSIQARTKEIGIRKVLGASVASLLVIVSKEFVVLILIALCIASPIAYMGLTFWLKDFAYRIEPQWWLFILAGLFVITIALLTIGFRATKAALSNPVKALKTE